MRWMLHAWSRRRSVSACAEFWSRRGSLSAAGRSVAAAVLAAAVVVGLPGCSSPEAPARPERVAAEDPMDCKQTRIEAQSVRLVEADEPVVRFTARLTDEDGRPIEGAEVTMGLRYGTTAEEAGGPSDTGGRTDADGVAVADAPVRTIKLLAQSAIFPEWTAFYPTPDKQNYCESRDRGHVPDEIVELGPPRR